MVKVRYTWSAIVVALVLLVLAPAQAAVHTTYYITNAQGTTVAEMDSQSNVSYLATYRPYGQQQTGSVQPGPGYTGHVNDPDTGLVYMQARYYDPNIGRFLSLDPAGLKISSLYSISRFAYANNNPIKYIDLTGAFPVPPIQNPGPFSEPGPGRVPQVQDIPGGIPGGPWTPAPEGSGQNPGSFYGPKIQGGPRMQLQYVPRQGDGGPKGSKGYWKTKSPGQKGWQRYNQEGEPITPEEAHPGNQEHPQLKSGSDESGKGGQSQAGGSSQEPSATESPADTPPPPPTPPEGPEIPDIIEIP